MKVGGSALPPGWVSATLGDLGEWVGGGTPAKSNPRYWQDGTIPWVSPKDMKSAVIADTEDRITPEALAASGIRQVPSESVLVVTRSGILQRTVPVATTAVSAVVNQVLKALVPHPGISASYVAAYIRSFERDILDHCSKDGTTVASIGFAAFLQFPIALPPAAEQRRIVLRLGDIVSHSQMASSALSEAINLLDTYRQAILAAAFGGDLTSDWRRANPHLAQEWRRTSWRDVGRCQNGRAFPSSEYASTGIRLLRPGNLHASGRIEWTEANTRYLPSAWAERFPTYVVGPGEIVMNLTAQSLKDEFLGRACMTSPEERCLLNQRIARLIPLGIDARYAFWLFKSPLFRRYVDNLSTGSLNQHMFTSQVDKFVLPVPSREEQLELVHRIETMLGASDSVGATIAAAQRRVKPLERSIVARALRGELIPQDSSDEPASVLLDRIRAKRNSEGTASQPRAERKAGL